MLLVKRADRFGPLKTTNNFVGDANNLLILPSTKGQPVHFGIVE